MSKVYVLMQGFCEESEILAVLTDRSEADLHVGFWNSRLKTYHLYVQEFELNKLPNFIDPTRIFWEVRKFRDSDSGEIVTQVHQWTTSITKPDDMEIGDSVTEWECGQFGLDTVVCAPSERAALEIAEQRFANFMAKEGIVL